MEGLAQAQAGADDAEEDDNGNGVRGWLLARDAARGLQHQRRHREGTRPLANPRLLLDHHGRTLPEPDRPLPRQQDDPEASGRADDGRVLSLQRHREQALRHHRWTGVGSCSAQLFLHRAGRTDAGVRGDHLARHAEARTLHAQAQGGREACGLKRLAATPGELKR